MNSPEPKAGVGRWPYDEAHHAWWVSAGWLLAGEYPTDREGELEPLALLFGAGIRTFVDLTTPADGLRRYDDLFPAAAAAVGVDPAEIRHLRHPIPDMDVIELVAYDPIVAVIDAELAEGRPVYVHCWGGVGRTGTVVGCWLMRHGTPGSEVIERLAELRAGTRKAHRPCPEAPVQARLLQQWARAHGV